jgi:hypothetical protein
VELRRRISAGQYNKQRDIEQAVEAEGRVHARHRDDHAADGRTEAARDIVTDAVERDRREYRVTDTCSRTEDCHAGVNIAMPLPMTKQKPSNTAGVANPAQEIRVSPAAPINAALSAQSCTSRRSRTSVIARQRSRTAYTG